MRSDSGNALRPARAPGSMQTAGPKPAREVSMKLLMSAILAVFLWCVPLAAQQVPAGQLHPERLTPPNTSGMQTTGKVGATNYKWTNGRAWMTLSDNAKVALVAGIEQGVILSVRDNWDEVPKPAQQEMVKTATQLTVGGFTFTQLAVDIDAFYLTKDNRAIPVVDAYEYALLRLKKASKKQLKHFLENLRKTYKLPKPGKER